MAAEALAFSGVEAGEMDVTFLDAGDGASGAPFSAKALIGARPSQ
mgnify:CR=1 FL=1